ncbi:MAG: hypothetical protein WED11_07000, partial [Natronospirillum sp.]
MPLSQKFIRSMSLMAAIFILLSQFAHAEVARSPLFLTQGLPPNILLLLDNSSTMAEAITGEVAATCSPPATEGCLVGVAAPNSKGEIARSVARQLIDQHENRINLGLMAYQQYPYSDNWG